ncbi:MAG: hypothetical protein JJE52_06105 [Acidimicrobiia bacterium]|nr:hypothetical protein [Acidimicrobiia bacterium]
MAITEPKRHKLYQHLTDVLGPEEADTLMEHLPPVGWANVATKDDLARLDVSIDGRFAHMDVRFAQVDVRFAQVDARFEILDANLRSYIDRAIRTSTLVTVGVLGTLTTVVTTLSNL